MMCKKLMSCIALNECDSCVVSCKKLNYCKANDSTVDAYQLELRAIDPNTSFSCSPGDDYWKPFISRQMLSIIN